MEYSNIHKQFFKTIKLPKAFHEEDRGLDDCCCEPFIAFGSESSESYKKDYNSAWIPNADEVRFYLIRQLDGLEIEQESIPFINQPTAYYCTVDWSSILFNYGFGRYKLAIEFSVSGISDTLVWATFNLLTYSIKRKQHMVRIRSVFNSFHERSGIDMTGSNVVDCINVFGFFGGLQPKTVINNTIYATRETKKVVRENLSEYILTTDPLKECFTKRLIDIHLLHENELYISDHNAINHSYNYFDKPVILSESASIEYSGRLGSITAKFGDKFKNNRSLFTK